MRSVVEVLVARYDADQPASAGGASTGGAERRLAGSLDALGWQSASDAPASAVAPELAMMIRACVRGHRDVDQLRRAIADCLRRHSHPLDGSGTSASAWEPFARQVIMRYAGVPSPSRAGVPTVDG